MKYISQVFISEGFERLYLNVLLGGLKYYTSDADTKWLMGLHHWGVVDPVIMLIMSLQPFNGLILAPPLPKKKKDKF